MLRYSLGSLFLSLLYLSIQCAALVNANGIWPQVAVTLTVVVLAVFSLVAVFGSERWRVFAIAFSATGWLYVLLAFSNVTNLRTLLLSEAAMNRLYVTMHSDNSSQVTLAYGPANGAGQVQRLVFTGPVQPIPAGQPYAPVAVPTPVAASSYAAGPYASVVQPLVDAYTFANIGHALCAVIAGFIGGIVAQLLHRQMRPRATQQQ